MYPRFLIYFYVSRIIIWQHFGLPYESQALL